MLTLLFNQAPKRRPVGLLALGLWAPATGEISGSGSTEQAGQRTQGNVLWFLADTFHPQVLSSGDPAYGGYLVEEDVYPVDRLVEVAGDVFSWQAEQRSEGEGQLRIAGMAASTQRRQNLSGSAVWGTAGECNSRQSAARADAVAETVDLELELLTIMLGV